MRLQRVAVDPSLRAGVLDHAVERGEPPRVIGALAGEALDRRDLEERIAAVDAAEAVERGREVARAAGDDLEGAEVVGVPQDRRRGGAVGGDVDVHGLRAFLN